MSYLMHILWCVAQLPKRPALAGVLSRDAAKIARRTAAGALGFVRKYASAALPFSPPRTTVPAVPGDAPDYIIFGTIDWHFRHQRPQHLARMLAQSGRRVFYVSSDFRDDLRPGFEAEALDDSGRLFRIKLFRGRPGAIYSHAPSAATVRQLRAGLGRMLEWAGAGQVSCVVQHAFWYDVARALPDSRLIYDCMDSHEGFGNSSPDILALETSLLKAADVTVATSPWLQDFAARHGVHAELVRNACDYEHFSHVPASIYRDPQGRRIVGYYGAIASWFDLDLVAAVARHLPDCCILLIGADTIGATFKLAHFKKIEFVGEVDYSRLPYYLHAFDVALLPFRVNDLTLATNPVKVYEYLAAGKAVVSVDLPETAAFAGLIRVANTHDAFIGAIGAALQEVRASVDAPRRRAFAAENTWSARARDLIRLAEEAYEEPRISVIVVTYNNLELTRACLQSLDAHSRYPNLEVVVVDNASSDGTRAFLAQWVSAAANRKILLNETNKGFAAANNQGMALADGAYFVLLNNDTVVTPGWLRTLYRHVKFDPGIGMIGPVTNRIGNQAEIPIRYKHMGAMVAQSRKYTLGHIGETITLRTVAFFCVMIPRAVVETVGYLDEAFGLGFFEDDDYCRRVEQSGYRIACAEDVFVHHHLSASFLKLEQETRREIYRKSKAVYESKWGPWEPHRKRGPGSLRLLRRIFS
jgi:GT2 family glycosyltransferase/glycosyltransferase involved in cell wall biosynthesis